MGRTIRLLGCVMAMVLSASIAFAQRGGPPGGGMGGPPPMGGGERGRMGGIPEVAPPQPRSGLHLAPPGRWWDDRKTAKAVGLRSEQQKRMDDIFEANRGQLETAFGNLKREVDHLGSMSREDLQDEAKVDAAIDRVAVASAELEKAKAHYQLQIRKELDSSQLAALDSQIRQSF